MSSRCSAKWLGGLSLVVALGCGQAETSPMRNGSNGSSAGGAGGSAQNGEAGGNPASDAGTSGVGTGGGGVPGIGGNGGEVAGGGGTVGGGGASTAQECSLEATQAPATVELFVNRAGSMMAAFNENLDRWNAVRNVLVGEMGLVAAYQAQLRFGLALYSGAEVGAELETACPQLFTTPFDLNNYTAIHDTLMANEATGQNALGDALLAELERLQAVQNAARKVIVLVGVGDPDTCIDPDSNGQMEPKEYALSAAQMVWDAGISIHAINVTSESLDGQFMQDFAVAGAGGDPAATYYDGSDLTKLTAALQEIFDSLIPCDFQLSAAISDLGAAQGNVMLNGQPVTYQDGNGYVLLDPRTLRLQGLACDAIKAPNAALQVSFPCNVITQ
ncbi:MAG TPA: hypothetical protein VHO25_10055 [Polyangiaceae bacterium]|nr:hypothetical protein [Polyangiaceae bacterium]